MAAYDGLMKEIKAHVEGNEILPEFKLLRRSASVIAHLQAVVKHYNSDDEIFDDEKAKVTEDTSAELIKPDGIDRGVDVSL